MSPLPSCAIPGCSEPRYTLRDIDNRDDDEAPYEFTGTAEQIIGYLNGPLRSDLVATYDTSRLDSAIEAVRTGDLEAANEHLADMAVHLRRADT